MLIFPETNNMTTMMQAAIELITAILFCRRAR
jgi:hypothetical protein